MFLHHVTYIMLHTNNHYAGHSDGHAQRFIHRPQRNECFEMAQIWSHDTLAARNMINLLGNWIDYRH